MGYRNQVTKLWTRWRSFLFILGCPIWVSWFFFPTAKPVRLRNLISWSSLGAQGNLLFPFLGLRKMHWKHILQPMLVPKRGSANLTRLYNCLASPVRWILINIQAMSLLIQWLEENFSITLWSLLIILQLNL